MHVSVYSHDISLQLYSLKPQSMEDPEQMLASVKGLGFGAVETAGDYGWDCKRWRDLLMANGLSVSGAHVLMERLEDELPQIADFFAHLDCFHLVVPVPPEGEGTDRFRRCAERLNAVAEQAKSRGCVLSYHNHWWEFEDLGGGRRGIDLLLAGTDPELVAFQIDTAWALAGGGDPLGFLRENRDRIRCLHAKEYRIAEADEPPMGEGDVPFRPIVELAVEEGWPLTVEHEPGSDAPVAVRHSATYLKNLIAEIGR